MVEGYAVEPAAGAAVWKGEPYSKGCWCLEDLVRGNPRIVARRSAFRDGHKEREEEVGFVDEPVGLVSRSVRILVLPPLDYTWSFVSQSGYQYGYSRADGMVRHVTMPGRCPVDWSGALIDRPSPP